MNRDRDKLLEQMGRLVVPVLSPEREAELQARTTAAVDRTLQRLTETRSVARRSSWRGGSGAVIAAAAAIALIAFASVSLLRAERVASVGASKVLFSTAGVSIVRSSGVRSPAEQGGSLSPGDQLATASGAHARLVLADGSAVEVASETRLRVAAATERGERSERLELEQGEVSLRVPKLEAGSTLSVRTPDTLVIVHGTRFSVNVDRNAGSVVTRVSVAEGRVEVRSQGRHLFLTGGERWSSATEAPAAKALALPEATEPVSDADGQSHGQPPVSPQAAKENERSSGLSQPRSAGTSAKRKPGFDERPSTLAEENALYQSALSTAQQGDLGRSLALLETLMRQYPRSPLLQSARVEHFRLLLQMGNVSAAGREARRYLSDYPSGFARAEARQIALRGLGDAE